MKRPGNPAVPDGGFGWWEIKFIDIFPKWPENYFQIHKERNRSHMSFHILKKMEFFSEKLPILSGMFQIHNLTYFSSNHIGFCHSHNSYEIYFQLSGLSKFIIEEQTISIKEKDLLIISPGVRHELVYLPHENFSSLSINFDWIYQPANDPFYKEYVKDEKKIVEKMLDYKYAQVEDSCDCMNTIEKLCQDLKSRRMGEYIKLRNLVTDFLLSAAQSFSIVRSRKDFDEITDVGISNKAIKIAEYIKNHHTEDISLQSVSEALAYSSRHIQRIILEYYNVTFSDLLHEYRIGKAKRMLFESDWSIEILSQKVGYNTRKSLCKHFKNRVGLTPSEFRMKIKDQEKQLA